MKLRSETRQNIRLLATIPEPFNARDLGTHLGWGNNKARSILTRMARQNLFHVESISIYLHGDRAASRRASACTTTRLTKVKHYRLTDSAKDQALRVLEYRGKPYRMVNSVFALGG